MSRTDEPTTGAGDRSDTRQAASAVILDPTIREDQRTLESLRTDPTIVFLDRSGQQTVDEPPRWVYYPWRRAVVGVLGPHSFARVRTDRNRNLITPEERRRLGTLRVGVVGLSVGHAIAHTLAMEALCGELRLADFDDLELTNLNRVPATVFDIGINKATAAARHIAEIDPYLSVRVLTTGLTADSLDEFLDGLDVVVEECDSLDMKALVREAARRRRQPVVMATSDRGLVDIERFDLEPRRPIFHGLLGDVDTATLAGLDSAQKVPYLLRIIDGANLSARGAASLVEVGQTLDGWPQLAGDVLAGASAVAEAVRRIGLAEPLPSGRVRVDLAKMLDDLNDPATVPPPVERSDVEVQEQTHRASRTAVGAVLAAAARAPSGGNVQPWDISSTPDAVTIRLAPEFTTAIDVSLRGSAVAVGAAAFNARAAAAAHHVLGPVEFVEKDCQTPLEVVVTLAPGDDERLAGYYPGVSSRETNRHRGTPSPLTLDVASALREAADREGARIALLVERNDLDRAGAVLAEADRIRYLTPTLHAEMISELRWPGDPSPDMGIDVRSLELGAADVSKLDILRRADVMALLAEWDGGSVLGDDARRRVAHSSALAVVITDDMSLSGYARGGAAAEAVWITAQENGLAVQPMSPSFLYAHDEDELKELSTPFAAQLNELQIQLRELTATRPSEAQILILRLTTAPPPSFPSRRRPLKRTAPPVF